MRRAGGRHGMNGREGGMVQMEKPKQRGWKRGMRLACRFDRLLSGLSEFFLVSHPLVPKTRRGRISVGILLSRCVGRAGGKEKRWESHCKMPKE